MKRTRMRAASAAHTTPAYGAAAAVALAKQSMCELCHRVCYRAPLIRAPGARFRRATGIHYKGMYILIKNKK